MKEERRAKVGVNNARCRHGDFPGLAETDSMKESPPGEVSGLKSKATRELSGM